MAVRKIDVAFKFDGSELSRARSSILALYLWGGPHRWGFNVYQKRG
jgi:hypothetical protein